MNTLDLYLCCQKVGRLMVENLLSHIFVPLSLQPIDTKAFDYAYDIRLWLVWLS
jgi:hypothetical protein